MEQEKLKPCPFCGSDAETTFNTLFGFQVYCTNDDCLLNELLSQGFDDEKKMIDKWNRRVTTITHVENFYAKGARR